MTNQPVDPASTEPYVPVAPEPAPGVAPVIAQLVRTASGGSSRVLNLALAVAVLVAAAGVAFAVGRATAPANATAGAGNGGLGNVAGDGALPGANGYFGRGDGVPGDGGRGGFGPGGGLSISGTVDSVTADSVTIGTESGQTITIGMESSTAYHQQAAASSSDVQAGKTVIVQLSGGFRPGANGAANGNGSVTLGSAGSITVVP